MTQRLHVVHDSRAHIETEHCRKIRGFDAWIRPLAFQRLDQPGFLATNVSAGSPVNVNLQVVTGAQDVLAEKPVGPRFRQRLVQQLGAVRHLAPDVDVGKFDVVGPTRDHHPLDQLVGIFVDDLAVLEGARLGLVGVADQVNRLATATVHKAPLQPGAEARSAPAAQPGFQHFVADDFLGRLALSVGQRSCRGCHRLLERLISAMAQVTRDIRCVARRIGVLQDQFELFGHGCA